MEDIKTIGKYKPRRGLRDIWGASMVEGAEYADGDIPVCPCTARTTPTSALSWTRAKALCRRMERQHAGSFCSDAFIHFYLDDYKFDGPRSGIWQHRDDALDVIRHFGGIVTPDYSTYQDFPDPIKRLATYRMRAFGYWAGRRGVAVINNVRWGTEETWDYCFAGIPRHSIVAIGTVGGSPRRLRDRTRFNRGFEEMLRRLEPRAILVVGSASYPCFEAARQRGIQVVAVPSETALAFERKASRE